MELLARTVGNAAGLWLAVTFVGGLSVAGAPTTTALVVNYLVLGFVLALVNSIIKPIASFLAFPLYVLTFGLFALVVNGLMLMLTSALSGTLGVGMHVAGMGSAILGSIIVSIVSAIIVSMIGPKDDRR